VAERRSGSLPWVGLRVTGLWASRWRRLVPRAVTSSFTWRTVSVEEITAFSSRDILLSSAREQSAVRFFWVVFDPDRKLIMRFIFPFFVPSAFS
jgi:hypothetical protein